VIIPGGGQEDSGRLAPWVEARCEAALTLKDDTKFFVVLSRSTPHRAPPLDKGGFPVDESHAAAAWLLERGITKDRILIDSFSLDTIGNVWFALVCLCRPLGLRNLCVVTSEFHMERTRALFEWVSAMRDCPFEDQSQLHDLAPERILYLSTENRGASDGGLDQRRAKEKKSVEMLFDRTMRKVCCLRDLVLFMFTNHGAYDARALEYREEKDFSGEGDPRRGGGALY